MLKKPAPTKKRGKGIVILLGERLGFGSDDKEARRRWKREMKPRLLRLARRKAAAVKKQSGKAA